MFLSSSSSTQAQLLPSTSSISTSNSESQPPIPTSDDAPSNNMVTPIESSSSIITTSSSRSVIKTPSDSNKPKLALAPITPTFTHSLRQRPVNNYGKRVKAANGIYREFSFPILQTSNSVFSSQFEIANILGETFQSVSSTASYNSRFLEIKRRAKRTPMNFSTRSFFPYNCNFTRNELKKALVQAHNTSPGLDGITYTMLRRLNPDSITNILFLFNRVWKEHCFPSSWREAIVIPILKPGKVATDPLSYRPIALKSCFCKTFERMVNNRFVYVLEKEKLISSLQSGFRKGRSTLDNIVFLESQIRDAFVRRNHLVSLFFDIGKAYDRT
ncbi:probable RNA-directed DNA polymerase from transposon X-element [Trichonephila clavipes]|nr:probable RNA-directed DNA polymerase from transposon X-element [Trichonephila clavipes]